MMMVTPDVHDDYPADRLTPPQLLDKSFAIVGNKLYAKYPIPLTFCSDHTKACRSMRNINNIMMHICGKDHQSLPTGKMKTINICSICNTSPRNIVAHMKNLHEMDIFDANLKPVDMKDISDNKQPIWRSYYGCADIPWS
jgi:hypothetical protein